MADVSRRFRADGTYRPIADMSRHFRTDGTYRLVADGTRRHPTDGTHRPLTDMMRVVVVTRPRDEAVDTGALSADTVER